MVILIPSLMAIFHNRKLFSFLSNSSSSSPPPPPPPCYDFCNPSCSDFDDCYYFPDPPDSLSPLPEPPPLPLPPPPPLPPAVEQAYQLSPVVVIVVVVVATVFLLVSCCAFVLKCFTSWTHFLTRRNNPNPSQSGPQHESDNLFGEVDDQDHPVVDHPIWFISTVGLQQSVINSITVVRYKRGDGLIEGTDCSVCLGEFQEGETLRLLPKCNHAFHIACIDPWLRSHTNCPLCRAGIVVNPDPTRPGMGPNETGLGNSTQSEVTQMQDSDSSDVELGRSQTGDANGVVESRGDDDHPEVDNDDQNKAEDEIANNESWNGIGGRLVLERRSFSTQFFPGSNSSLFQSMGSSSSWRPQEARSGPSSIMGPIKRSYSWSERVFGTTNNQKCNSRFSP